jgi:8-oxo-dGTP pyrophosphatase MutT (NUDIX family)
MKKNPFCSNCGETGHYLKNCLSPVTSYGVILVKLPEGFLQAEELLHNENSISGYERVLKDIQFLMIQRRDSLGFIELMRGKYKITDVEYIKYHIATMTSSEHKKLLTNDFDSLWSELWGTPKEQSLNYKSDKESSKVKFNLLKEGVQDLSCNKIVTLESMINDIKEPWLSAEWGFPKGRRDPREYELQCAFRELYEETGIEENDVLFVRNLEPITETFFGSNHIHYCHKYYIMFYNSEKEVKYDSANKFMAQEIGDVNWFTLDECLKKIRPENIEKKEVLLRASSMLRGYCPLRYT